MILLLFFCVYVSLLLSGRIAPVRRLTLNSLLSLQTLRIHLRSFFLTGMRSLFAPCPSLGYRLSFSSASFLHAKIARAFIDDLALNEHIFMGFYQYGRERVFLESLNFYLEVGLVTRFFLCLTHFQVVEYRNMPYWERISAENRIFTRHVDGSSARHMVNLEAKVVQKARAQQGFAR